MNIGRYIPWAALGGIVGTVVFVPLVSYVIDNLYYKNKYTNEAEQYYQQYITNSYDIKVVMPYYDSKLYLYNVDSEKYPLSEVFDTTYDSRKYFINPQADYKTFYCREYKKYLNIISFFSVNGAYGSKEVYLTINRDDMNNPEYGTKDNPVPVLRAVGVHESIRDNNKDYDKAYMDSFYRKNVIMYLKYKMPKDEFERRFKNKE